MNSKRIALIYGVSMLGAAGVAYLRGRTHVTDMLSDAILHGIVAGTVFNVVGYFTLADGSTVPLLAQTNAGVKGLGKLGAEGVKVLSNINVDQLYSTMKSGGVSVGPVPDNPSVVVQEES